MSIKSEEQEFEYLPVLKNKNRESILDILQNAIEYLQKKALKGRIYDPTNEKIRISYIKALIYAINTYNAILKDTEIEELKEKIKLIESIIKNPNTGDNDEEVLKLFK